MSSKLIRDGKVAVLYSPGWGAGWSTWNWNTRDPQLVFDPVIVDFVLNKPENWYEGILAYCSMAYPDVYTGGVDTLEVEWIPVGTHFLIEEYDGNESIQVKRLNKLVGGIMREWIPVILLVLGIVAVWVYVLVYVIPMVK